MYFKFEQLNMIIDLQVATLKEDHRHQIQQRHLIPPWDPLHHYFRALLLRKRPRSRHCCLHSFSNSVAANLGFISSNFIDHQHRIRHTCSHHYSSYNKLIVAAGRNTTVIRRIIVDIVVDHSISLVGTFGCCLGGQIVQFHLLILDGVLKPLHHFV